VTLDLTKCQHLGDTPRESMQKVKFISVLGAFSLVWYTLFRLLSIWWMPVATEQIFVTAVMALSLILFLWLCCCGVALLLASIYDSCA
jgi:hypothetical protein